MALDVFKLFQIGKMIYDTAKDIKDISDLQKDEGFQNEIQDIENELKEKNDYTLLVDFHREYAENYGDGLVPDDHASRIALAADPVFKAYHNVFTERKIYKVFAFCSCEKKLGYRMRPTTFSTERDIYLGKGDWKCGFCDKHGTWEIDSSNEIYIREDNW